MEELDLKNLKLWISLLTPEKLEYCIEGDILPIFTTRTLLNTPYVANWHETSVHFPEIAPSGILQKLWKYEGTIGEEEFKTKYILELNKINFRRFLRKIDLMRTVCSAESVVLLGHPDDRLDIVADYINSMHILEDKITEL